ncbi:MAG: hypothetical protein BWY19_00313 [bacterium ADurb.Bin212]|nr:MAG: hypothetical protein BWY19_00313 [bacterium ADurb.Bin212]
MIKRISLAFILLNLIWSAIAFFVDYKVIGNIPFYFWPFTIICPLFPFLLFILWLREHFRKNTRDLWLSLFSIPPIAYFFGSLIYYPYWMLQNGFNLYAFGQIFWVAFYGIQGIWFSIKRKNDLKYDLVAISYIVISFIIQYFGETYGYFDTSNISNLAMAIIYALIVLLTLAIVLAKRYINIPSPLFSKR